MDQHLVHNVAELVPYLAFVLFRIPLPLTPIQILTIDTGTDSVTALGLGSKKLTRRRCSARRDRRKSG